MVLEFHINVPTEPFVFEVDKMKDFKYFMVIWNVVVNDLWNIVYKRVVVLEALEMFKFHL